jgi:tetratricopeptide (TPR) repeat protein
MADQIQSPDVRNADPQPPSFEATRLHDLAAENIATGRYDDALVLLSGAADLAPEHAQIRSLLGLSIAFVERDFARARTLCESAAKQEFFNPDVYLNLARVYLVFGRRSEALRYLRRGQMIDPGNESIQLEMSGLGRRRMPIVPFLPRHHPINRALGGARSMIRESLFGRAAA